MPGAACQEGKGLGRYGSQLPVGHQLTTCPELSYSKTLVFAPFPFSAPRMGLGGDQTEQVTKDFNL